MTPEATALGILTAALPVVKGDLTDEDARRRYSKDVLILFQDIKTGVDAGATVCMLGLYAAQALAQLEEARDRGQFEAGPSAEEMLQRFALELRIEQQEEA